MSSRMIALLGCLAAFWIFGLLGQIHSGQATMRYLALSLALVAIAAWRWQPQPALLQRLRNRRRPPEQR